MTQETRKAISDKVKEIIEASYELDWFKVDDEGGERQMVAFNQDQAVEDITDLVLGTKDFPKTVNVGVKSVCPHCHWETRFNGKDWEHVSGVCAAGDA